MTEEEFDAAFANEEFYFWGKRPGMKITAGFCSVGHGWLQLIHDCIKDIIKLGWDKEICQAKEKFGGLRFYINSGSDEVFARIAKAEGDSYTICEVCGSTEDVDMTSHGWMRTLCAKCDEKAAAAKAAQDAEYKAKYEAKNGK